MFLNAVYNLEKGSWIIIIWATLCQIISQPLDMQDKVIKQTQKYETYKCDLDLDL